MAYELKRTNRITEGVSINGEEIPVILDLDSMATEFTKKFNAIIRTEAEIKKVLSSGVSPDNITEVLEAYGEGVLALFQLIFGVEGTNKILAFYDNKYIEMLSEVLPFITNFVIPAIKIAAEDKQQKFTDIHKSKKHKKLWGVKR